jgi:general secretion pathway protein G
MKAADDNAIAARPARWLKIGLFSFLGLFGAVALLPLCVCERHAKADTTRNVMSAIETGLKLYRNRHGAYPTAAEGLRILVQERIFDRMPRDAWGNDVAFLSDGTRYEITSYGADGAPGGAGNDADIRSSSP